MHVLYFLTQKVPETLCSKEVIHELHTWGEIYDGAKAEVRHMIIARLVDRIDVEADNKVTITYKVSFEQFTSKKKASA